jgi:tetratricopeptide (TPR) repeat protein
MHSLRTTASKKTPKVEQIQRDSTHAKFYSVENRAPFIVPFDRNPNFTGRETQLDEAEEKIFAAGRTNKIAITGLGGIGKTQLVLELVYRIRERYKKCSVIWMPATNLESLQQAYLQVARQLKIPGSDEDKADAKKLVQGYLSDQSAGQWLLVFDNADDVNMWITQSGLGSGRLIDYLPRSEQGCIVFTTRDRKTAVKLAHRNIIEVPEMDEDVAIQLLQNLLVNPDLVDNRPDATALLTELTYLPLAIVQAAAYINENGIAFSDYLSLITDQEEAVIDLLSEQFEDDGRYDNIKNPVAITWLISFEQIQDRDPLAAEYLSFMACIDSKDIPLSLLPPGVSRKKEIDAIGTLEAYSFILKRATDLALDLHRLVHLATRNWLRQKHLLAQWTERTITRLEKVFPDNDHHNRNKWRTYLPHVYCVIMSAEAGKDGETWDALLWRFGRCLRSDGRYNEAEAPFVQVMERRKRVLGQEHPGTLASISNLALTYQNQGRWKEAESLQVQALDARKRVLGQEHPDTLASMNNLAVTYKMQGRWRKAEELKLTELDVSKRVLGQEHPGTLTSINNLASTYRDQGRWKEAEALQVQALDARKRVLGQEHPDTLTSMNNLASIYFNQGRWKEAEALGIQALDANKRVLGQEHPDTLSSMNNLALTYQSQGRWKEAEALGIQALDAKKRVLGQEHPDTLTSMNNLASTYWNQGRWKEAEDLEVQALEMSKRVLGQEHPHTLIRMGNLAITWKANGRATDALELLKHCVEARVRILGANHPATLSSSTALLEWEAEKLLISTSVDRE